jgi:DNA-3-methyladenine glycosylase II
MVGRIIETGACVAEGAAWLAARHPEFALILNEAGPLPLRRRSDGFAALLDAIIGQQVSTASADAIWAKLEAAGLTGEDAIRAASEDDLRACGFSRQKIRYGKALAEARLDYAALRDLPNEDLIETLTALPGIGRWTAEVYAIISLGRADVFAPGDLALREAARLLFNLPERPSEGELRRMAEGWSPWRAIAARALWAYYRVAKSREGMR